VRFLAEAASSIRDVGSIELVIADFHSDDWPLSEWLEQVAGELHFRVVQVDGPFSRGRGLNLAVAQAASDRLFLGDADILIDPAALRRSIEILDGGLVWFPICRYLNEAGQLDSWNEFGFGLVGIHRSTFDASGGLPEFYSWGGEDYLFFERLALHVPLVRELGDGLDHQWHPRNLRFEYYSRPRSSDFQKHFATAASTSPLGRPLKKFHGNHPAWQGELHLFQNGRMSRPGVDAGDFHLEERRQLVLKWDRWPPTTLHWHEVDHVYCDRTGPFTLREIQPDGPSSRADN
jgi:glycosyltransferase involved in cell wall biosynthesis